MNRCTQFARVFAFAFIASFAGAVTASEQPPTLAIGAAMPPCSLPGIV
jgi:hypothetical protein